MARGKTGSSEASTVCIRLEESASYKQCSKLSEEADKTASKTSKENEICNLISVIYKAGPV